MKAYCNRQGYQRSLVRFRFEGKWLRKTDTPEVLEMEDEDAMEVWIDNQEVFSKSRTESSVAQSPSPY